MPMEIYWKHLRFFVSCILILSSTCVGNEIWLDERDYDENYDAIRTFPRREINDLGNVHLGFGLQEAIKDYYNYEQDLGWNDEDPHDDELREDATNERAERHVAENEEQKDTVELVPRAVELVPRAVDNNEEAGVVVEDEEDASKSLFGEASTILPNERAHVTVTENDQVAKVDYSKNEDRRDVLKLDPLKLFKDPLFYKNHSEVNGSALQPKFIASGVRNANGHRKDHAPIAAHTHHDHTGKYDKLLFIAIIAACSVAGLSGLLFAGYCLYRLRQERSDFKSTVERSPKLKRKPNSSLRGSRKWKDQFTMTSDDDKLARDAEVYHFGHAKKEMSQLQRHGSLRSNIIDDASDTDDDDDNEDTVYECPGLAPTSDMKVVNPLFSDAESHHSQDSRGSNNNTISPPPSISATSGELEYSPPSELNSQ